MPDLAPATILKLERELFVKALEAAHRDGREAARRVGAAITIQGIPFYWGELGDIRDRECDLRLSLDLGGPVLAQVGKDLRTLLAVCDANLNARDADPAAPDLAQTVIDLSAQLTAARHALRFMDVAGVQTALGIPGGVS